MSYDSVFLPSSRYYGGQNYQILFIILSFTLFKEGLKNQ